MTRKIAALAASLALLASSTPATASGNAQDTQTQIPSPWIMLTTLSASENGTDGGQASELPPPPPRRNRDAPGYFLGSASPMLPVVVWIALVALIVSTPHHQFIRPNSPA